LFLEEVIEKKVSRSKRCLDYFAFGKTLRSFNNTGKYAYQGSEKDKELSENDYYTHFRELEVEIARWKQVDPLADKFLWQTTYSSMDNNPVNKTDPLGDGTDKIDGDIFNLKGEKIGSDGVDDKKVFLKNTTSSDQLSKEQSVAEIFQSKTDPLSYTKEVNITTDELNLRSSLSTLKQSEAGSKNKALDYNSWNNNKNFTDNTYATKPEDYSKHPGTNSASGSSAAGAYQFLKRFYKEPDFSPQSQDKAAVNNMTSQSYKAALSGNMSVFREATKGRWTSLDHWSNSNLQTIFNQYRANELQGISNIGTPTGGLLKK
jgi:RHS repeat-associated protein